MVFNVSDLWPESAVALGMVKNPSAIRLARGLETFIYRRSAAITAQTRGIVENIRDRCGERRVTWIPNGVDATSFQTISPRERDEIRTAWGLAGKFVAGYAGLVGLAQGLDMVVRTAEILAEYRDIVFAIVGEGPEKSRLMELVRKAGLTNVKFYPIQPGARMPGVVSSFDVALVPLRGLALFNGAVPSKLFEAMAAGVPVIVSIEGEARTLVEEGRAGICVKPEDAPGVARAILRLYRETALRSVMGENGRAYVGKHFERGRIACELEGLLLTLSGSGSQTSLRKACPTRKGPALH